MVVSVWPHSDQAAKYLAWKHCKSEEQEGSIFKKTQTVTGNPHEDYTHLCNTKNKFIA